RTADDGEALLAREKPGTDGAEPSGNSVAVMNLLRLSELTGDEHYRERAERALAAFGDALGHAPAGVGEMLLSLDFALDTPKEIVIVTVDERATAEADRGGARRDPPRYARRVARGRRAVPAAAAGALPEHRRRNVAADRRPADRAPGRRRRARRHARGERARAALPPRSPAGTRH